MWARTLCDTAAQTGSVPVTLEPRKSLLAAQPRARWGPVSISGRVGIESSGNVFRSRRVSCQGMKRRAGFEQRLARGLAPAQRREHGAVHTAFCKALLDGRGKHRMRADFNEHAVLVVEQTVHRLFKQ